MYFHLSIILFMKKTHREWARAEAANLQPRPGEKTKQQKRERGRKKRKATSAENAILLRYFNLYQQVVSISRTRTQDGASELGIVYQVARLNLPLPPPPAPPTRSCDDVTTGWWRQPSYGVGARVGDVTLAVIDVTVASL